MPPCEGSALAAGLTAKETAKAKQAKQLYKEGQYESAAKIFSSLSRDHSDMPVFTRNLGACYYYLGRPEPALSNLREYLQSEKDISPEDRKEVEGWMAEMEKVRSHVHAPTVAPVAPAPVPPIGVTPPPLAPASPSHAPAPSPPSQATPLPVAAAASPTAGFQGPSSAATSVDATATAQAPARSSNALAWGAGGVGVAGLVAGGVCTGLALSKFSSTEWQYNSGDESAGKTYAALQWVGYGVGVAGVGTAIVLFMLDTKPTGSVALTPMLGQGFAGASVAGTY